MLKNEQSSSLVRQIMLKPAAAYRVLLLLCYCCIMTRLLHSEIYIDIAQLNKSENKSLPEPSHFISCSQN
jgi:hypothetical protein